MKFGSLLALRMGCIPLGAKRSMKKPKMAPMGATILLNKGPQMKSKMRKKGVRMGERAALRRAIYAWIKLTTPLGKPRIPSRMAFIVYTNGLSWHAGMGVLLGGDDMGHSLVKYSMGKMGVEPGVGEARADWMPTNNSATNATPATFRKAAVFPALFLLLLLCSDG